MDIEISRDLQHYKESFVMGLTVKQFAYSVLSLGVGAGIVLGTYNKIGMIFSCYLATPLVVPIALTGFYNHNGLSFWQTITRMVQMSFFNRPCLYQSTECAELIQEAMEVENKANDQKQKKSSKSNRQDDFDRINKKAKRIIGSAVVLFTVVIMGVLIYQFFK